MLLLVNRMGTDSFAVAGIMVEPTNSDSIPSTAAGKSGEDADQLLNEARRQNCGKKAKKIFSQLGLKPVSRVWNSF